MLRSADDRPARDDADERAELREWVESLDWVIKNEGADRARLLLQHLQRRAYALGIELPFTANTPYINTIPRSRQPRFPGRRDLERRIKSIIRWNAMAMVVRANREHAGLGGHISTYQSAATLYEVGFNHFFRGKDDRSGGDQVYFQGHAAPGIYARAFIEGRLSEKHLENFRLELRPDGGLSSYPHPWLMPGFWEYPTVSMGLGPIMAIYQARFNRYLEDRGLVERTGRVWAFLGDGETDEPEALGAISLAARERLDNLVFVINCNLQRLDGPVRGNGKIIQELERLFRGAGWNVLKVIWGDDWDGMLDNDPEGLLVRRMEEAVDGDYQKYTVEDGAYIREHFFGKYPELLERVAHLSDDELQTMRRGGHDPEKVYAAYAAAVEHTGSPTVILAKTIKGYGLGEAGEGKNITHQQKKLNEEELREFRSRFGIPIADEDVGKAPFYRPAENRPEMVYLLERRERLGGFVPRRRTESPTPTLPDDKAFAEFDTGSGDREVSTTGVVVRVLSNLLKDREAGRYIVPIVPDEARTFGMESLFRQVGIYSHIGQVYEPVDKETLLYYKEARDGQILEEGITEAGSMSSFIAAGTAYAAHGVPTIPFFIYYSMFGFQRIGDLIWAAGDMRCRGFLVGGTAGRTTLNGEGLQHQDGHSHLLAHTNPRVVAYDPSFAYEIGTIVRDGIRRMYADGEDVMYYLTVGNEPYVQPEKPSGSDDDILRGLYRFRKGSLKKASARAAILGSGSLTRAALRAQEVLESDYGVAADVWVATSYQQLHRDATSAERSNRLRQPNKRTKPFVTTALERSGDVVVATSDNMKALPYLIAPWVPVDFVALGTDGFGRSETREALREFFEVDHRHVVLATLDRLATAGKVDRDTVVKASKDLDIDPDKPDPTRT